MIKIKYTEDIDTIMDLHQAIFKDREFDDVETHHLFLVTQDDQPVGFAGYELMPDGGGLTANLTRAGLLPIARGGGLQKKLIQARLRHAKRQGATYAITYVASWNCASLNNLIKCGFSFYIPAAIPEAEQYDHGYLYLQKKL